MRACWLVLLLLLYRCASPLSLRRIGELAKHLLNDLVLAHRRVVVVAVARLVSLGDAHQIFDDFVGIAVLLAALGLPIVRTASPGLALRTLFLDLSWYHEAALLLGHMLDRAHAVVARCLDVVEHVSALLLARIQ